MPTPRALTDLLNHYERYVGDVRGDVLLAVSRDIAARLAIRAKSEAAAADWLRTAVILSSVSA